MDNDDFDEFFNCNDIDTNIITQESESTQSTNVISQEFQCAQSTSIDSQRKKIIQYRDNRKYKNNNFVTTIF